MSKYTVLVISIVALLSINTEDIERIRAELSKIIPMAEFAEVTKSDANNVYEILFQGAYAYGYVNGDYVLIGDLYNSKELVNIGTEKTNKKIVDAVSKIPTSKMIVYGPEKPKRYITIFTDIDCGYCRQLHSELPQLTAAGIQVRYIAYPRAGLGSASYQKYVSVWCSDNPQEALTKAKAGQTIVTKSCENPITETYQLGNGIGVQGTPMVIFDDGTISPGYLPSHELIRRLGIQG